MLLLALLLALGDGHSALNELPAPKVVALAGNTHHVQGIAVRGDRLWLTSVNNAERKGLLFEFNARTGERLRTVELKDGERYHPGGIALDGDTLWIPLAEYRRESTTVVEQRSLSTLAVVRRFEVRDHIGCIAVGADRLWGGNWDAKQVYEWSRDGRELRRRDNPSGVKVQDWKYVEGRLVASGLTAPGQGSIAWLNPETLTPERTLIAGKTDRGVVATNEGMDLVGNDLYLVPEDTPSRLFTYTLAAQTASGDSTRALSQGSLNKPERLEWFRNLGFGMFIHWNVDVNLGSVISHSLVGASADYVKRYYEVLPRYFNPTRLDAREWAAMAKLAGMKYAVFTTKHHSGFTFWDTKTTPFSVMNTPYGKDIVKQFVDAFRAEGIAIGFYISPDDFWWFKENGYPIKRPPAPMTTTREIPALKEYGVRQIRELFTNYGAIDLLFIDGPPDGLREEAWRLNPNVVVTRGAIDTPEQHVPGIPLDQAWEACITIGDAWQHKPADQPKTSAQILETLIEIRAKGGNLLLNVGPKPDGRLSEGEEGRLRDLALWDFVNGESLNAVRPWIITNEQNVWFTRKKDEPTVYAFVTRSPWKLGEQRTLTLKSVRATAKTEIEIVGQSGEILEYRPEIRPKTTFRQDAEGLHITAMTAQRMYDDRRWTNPVVLRMTNVEAALKPPQVLTLERKGADVLGELRSLGDAKELEVSFEYRPRKGMTDLYEKTEPWRARPFHKVTAPGTFRDQLPAGDWEYRAVVRHPLLTLYGSERH